VSDVGKRFNEGGEEEEEEEEEEDMMREHSVGGIWEGR